MRYFCTCIYIQYIYIYIYIYITQNIEIFIFNKINFYNKIVQKLTLALV